MDGLSGKKPDAPTEAEIPPAALEAMTKSAMSEIQAKAGTRLPIVRGRDRGLPKTPPAFDPDVMAQRSREAKARLGRSRA